jgi:ParB family chromosome partitioning protein
MSGRRKDRLGKGLGALLGDYFEVDEGAEGEVRRVPVRAIVPNPLQPRKDFTADELKELAASIRENGLLQPLVVRPSPDQDDRFELVAGERRLRAVDELGWDDVPVLVRKVDDEALLVLALVENLQREELNPLEEAEGYRTLSERFGMTQEEIARSVGKNRSTVANILRLLRLPVSIRKMVQRDELSMGHARALLALDDPVRAADLARKTVREGWSVREVERRARADGKRSGRGGGGRSGGERERDPVLRALEEALREGLSTRVKIRGVKKGKGVIEVPFHSTEDFERIFALIAGREASEIVG